MKSATFYLLLVICQRDMESGRFDAGCTSYEAAEPSTYADCEATARFHRETTPAGLKAIAHACARERKPPMVAKR